jgi:hypothetical protein
MSSWRVSRGDAEEERERWGATAAAGGGGIGERRRCARLQRAAGVPALAHDLISILVAAANASISPTFG